MHKGQKTTPKKVSLKTLAEYLNLNPATISVVLNDVPGRSIPQATRDRIKEAAKRFNYEPNWVARSLRNDETRTVGLLVPELGSGYHSQVMSGIADYLMEKGFFYFIAHHRHRANLIEDYARILRARGAEGMITIDTALDNEPTIPTVAIAGHQKISGVANVLLDHECAAELALDHLYKLGHRRIAFMHGQSFSSDSETRWKSIVKTAKRLGIPISPGLTIHLKQDSISPELGYRVVRNLLEKKEEFTAIFCFNDITAIGAIRALRDWQLQVPEDVSVIGFDDIDAAAFYSPRLTTIRQPMQEMGLEGARLLLHYMQTKKFPGYEHFVKPELIIRESTAAARKKATKAGRS
jgi:DNA-binding LacI/PurR family transcriptional regulator